MSQTQVFKVVKAGAQIGSDYTTEAAGRSAVDAAYAALPDPMQGDSTITVDLHRVTTTDEVIVRHQTGGNI